MGSAAAAAEDSSAEEKKAPTFRSLGVCEQLAEACDALGWKAPTQIQVDAVPVALKGHDIIGLAQTGSGKTATFALPILQALLENPQPLFACVLSPTRELAIQIAEQFEALGSGIGLKCAVLVGGIDMMAQSVALAKRPHVVVGTPGRLVDHLTNTKGFSLRTIKYLVLDEADRLLNMDFEQEIDEILKVIPKERRTYLFSATMTTKVAKLQRACLKNPVKVEVSAKYSTVDSLKQEYLFIPAKYKDCYLVYILNELAGNTAMVFTRTCEATRKLSLVLRNLGFVAIPISGQMSQPKRLGALAKFKAGDCNILICTDVASRGLDIPSVNLVINYDIPTNSKDYIHRVGRTARAGRSGRAISMVCQYDVELYQKIEELIGKKLPEFSHQQEEVLLMLERVSEAQRLATMHMREKDGAKPLPVEAVIDSSRFFVLRVEDESSGKSKHAFLGLGFRERPQAYDFQAALFDHVKYLNKKKEADEITQEYEAKPSVDYSLKDGETLRLQLKNTKLSGNGLKPKPLEKYVNRSGVREPMPNPDTPENYPKRSGVPCIVPPPPPPTLQPPPKASPTSLIKTPSLVKPSAPASVPDSTGRDASSVFNDAADDLDEDFGDFQAA